MKDNRIPENIQLGENLKRIRETQGYTQETLAKSSGVGKNFISDLERGARGAGRQTVNRLCAALRVDELTLRFGGRREPAAVEPADYVALCERLRGIEPIELLEVRLLVEKFLTGQQRENDTG